MDNKYCCFAGHGEIYEVKVRERLKKEIRFLIEKHEVKRFLLGNYGVFDHMAAGILQELKKEFPDIYLELVVPYITKIIAENAEFYKNTYDKINVLNNFNTGLSKFGIVRCNEYIVERSQYMICYIRHSWGGAVKTLHFAEKKENIKIIKI